MHKDLMNILACPLCKYPLYLEVKQEINGEIITGILSCEQCNQAYTIEDSIPNLLPPHLKT